MHKQHYPELAGMESNLETQGLGYIPMVVEQSGRGERSYDCLLYTSDAADE